jgi:hypothetical protein
MPFISFRMAMKIFRFQAGRKGSSRKRKRRTQHTMARRRNRQRTHPSTITLVEGRSDMEKKRKWR